MLKTRLGLALGAALLAAAGAASASETITPRAYIPFANHGGIRDWKADRDQGLWVQDVHRHWYYAKLMGPCTGLDFAETIAFDTHPALAGGLAALVLAVVGYAAWPALFALPVTGIACGATVVGLVDLVGFSSSWTGGGLLLVAALWAVLVAFDVIRHRAVAVGVATALALIGAQFPEHAFIQYTTTLVVALVCFGCYLADRMPILLVGGVLGVTIAVPEAIWDWTAGAVNGAVLVLVAGAVLLLAGGLGLRIHRP